MAGVGAYGKMPGLGDFFRINPPTGFVGPWDIWLQTGLAEVRQHLGSRWQACYMSAPIWRFTLRPAVAGRRAVQGVLMPSVDRVGRCFPLTLMWAGPSGGLETHLAATPFFETLEEIALAALDDQSRAALAADLSALEPLCDTDAVLEDPVLQTGIDPVVHHPRSIWTAVLEGSTRLMGCTDLPNAAELTGLFDLSAPIWPDPATLRESTAS